MSRSVLAMILVVLGVLVFILAAPVIGSTAAIIIGILLAVIGVVVFFTANRDL